MEKNNILHVSERAFDKIQSIRDWKIERDREKVNILTVQLGSNLKGKI